MPAQLEQLLTFSPAEFAGLGLATLLLFGLVLRRGGKRGKHSIRLAARAEAARGLTVPAIARKLGVSQDAVRLLLGAEAATRQIEPTGNSYRLTRQAPPRKATGPRLGTRCDVSA